MTQKELIFCAEESFRLEDRSYPTDAHDRLRELLEAPVYMLPPGWFLVDSTGDLDLEVFERESCRDSSRCRWMSSWPRDRDNLQREIVDVFGTLFDAFDLSSLPADQARLDYAFSGSSTSSSLHQSASTVTYTMQTWGEGHRVSATNFNYLTFSCIQGRELRSVSFAIRVGIMELGKLHKEERTVEAVQEEMKRQRPALEALRQAAAHRQAPGGDANPPNVIHPRTCRLTASLAVPNQPERLPWPLSCAYASTHNAAA